MTLEFVHLKIYNRATDKKLNVLKSAFDCRYDCKNETFYGLDKIEPLVAKNRFLLKLSEESASIFLLFSR